MGFIAGERKKPQGMDVSGVSETYLCRRRIDLQAETSVAFQPVAWKAPRVSSCNGF
jgi:hypothetical protein